MRITREVLTMFGAKLKQQRISTGDTEINLEHDEADLDRKIQCPLLALWGRKGFVHRTYDVLGVWRERAELVEGKALECGHFLPEEAPASVYDELLSFFGNN
ncbi:MAG: alpha/beta hydrolase [Desulfuromonadales bacterium]|nr:alpha/beta hydrolase [Desulfuromonadales bacterium]